MNRAQCYCLKKAIKDISQESLEPSDTIIDIQRNFLSEINLAGKRALQSDRPSSEPNIHYIANYDDICGPWPSPDHPSYEEYDDTFIEPKLCAWKFITPQDIRCMKQNLFDKNVVLSIFEKKLSENIIFNSRSKELYLSLLWKIFKYMRNENFSGKAISSILGLFHLTHRFFLSNFWRAADETFTFFERGLHLHTILNLPDSDMVFNFFECDKILDMFWRYYMKKLELIRSISTTKYNVIFKIKAV